MKRKKNTHLTWKIRGLALAAFALGLTQNAAAQRVGLKTNALYWAAASPNIGMEFRVNRHITFNFEGAYNRIDISKINSKALVFNPEMRYWLSARPQAGHFIGIAGVAADYDITIKDKRHKGDAFGAGLTYGYSLCSAATGASRQQSAQEPSTATRNRLQRAARNRRQLTSRNGRQHR